MKILNSYQRRERQLSLGYMTCLKNGGGGLREQTHFSLKKKMLEQNAD